MRITGWLLAATALWIPAACIPAAESYPTRPIRLIVPSGTGGITDILARIVAQKLSERLGQQVVVDNRLGASGIVGSQVVANATPDGYTLLMVFPSHPVNPSLFPSLPYDTVHAFAPVTMVSAVASTLIVSANSLIKSVPELIALAKAKPGQLNYGDVGRGALNNLGPELFASMAGIKLTQVSYTGGASQILTALMSGEIQLNWIGTAGTVVTLERAGRVRPLGVTTKNRLPILPHVPPIADVLPGYEVLGWNGILAPAGTPKTVIDRLHDEIVKIVRSPEFGQYLIGEGATAVGNTPAEFDAIIRADIEKWAAVIKPAARNQ